MFGDREGTVRLTLLLTRVDYIRLDYITGREDDKRFVSLQRAGYVFFFFFVTPSLPCMVFGVLSNKDMTDGR